MLDQEGFAVRPLLEKQPWIPFARPSYGEAEAEAAADAVRSGWTTTGAYAERFANGLREYVGARHALPVNSCTAAMHVALTALGIGPGDEVITSPLTFCATVNVILQTGATPKLCDIGADLNLAPDAIRAALTRNTRAILPVHLAGLPCDLADIWQIAQERRLSVVEDAAHACGAAFGDTRIGAGLSDAVAFSFYATKNLSTGEGGMVTTPSPELADRMRLLALHGITRDSWQRRHAGRSWHYDVKQLGFKYNLSDIQAAIGCVQLQRLDAMNERRTKIAKSYSAAFSEVPGLTVAPEAAGRTHAWHLYILRIDQDVIGLTRDQFIEELRLAGIECSVHFIPIYRHSFYRDQLRMSGAACPNTEREFERIVSLPLYAGLQDQEVERVIAAVLHSSKLKACA